MTVKSIKPEWLFLIIYVIMGLIAFVSIPVMRVPDEPAHYLRAYEVSDGHMVSIAGTTANAAAGNYLPKGLLPNKLDVRKLNWHNFSELSELSVDYDSRKFYGFSNTALYSPINYFPQATGIAIFRHLTDSSIALAYAARIFNWLFAGVCIFFALRLMPRFKFLLLAVMILPMSLHQFNSLSADASLLALAALYLALVLHLRDKNEGIERWELLLLYAVGIGLSLTKLVYLPLVLLAVLIPRRIFSSPKAWLFSLAGLFILTGGLNLLWLHESAGLLVATHKADTDPAGQMAFILSDPVGYVSILLNSAYHLTKPLIHTMLGISLGWLDVPINKWIIRLCGLMVLIVPFMEVGHRNSFDNALKETGLALRERALMLGIVLIIIVLMATALYLQWTPYKQGLVAGLQGRYYLPLLLPVIIAIMPELKGWRGWGKLSPALPVLALFILDLWVFFKLACFHLK